MPDTLRANVPAAPATVALVIPGKPEEAVSEWRRLIRRVDPDHTGSYALDGPRLTAGAVVELPPGAVVMVVDRYQDRWHVRMCRAEAAGLETVHEWTLKTPLGKRVVDYVARRLAADAREHRYTPLEVQPNRRESWCRVCRGPVAAMAGRVSWPGGRMRVEHHPGQCPPPPEVVTPNWYAGLCFACGGWVAAGEGSAIRRTTPGVYGGKYQPMHGTPDGARCPDNPIPGPPNQVAGWCADCGELVAPGKGHWMIDLLLHSACPDERLGVPTWIARVPGSRRVRAGQVARVRLELWEDDPPVPEDAPGLRVLAAGFVELVAVVIEVVEGATGRQRARVRVATPDEAADTLAAEVALVPDVRPHPQGFKARFQAEKIGGQRPWLAEIVGRDPHRDFDRRFLRADRDYTRSNSKGTRGVLYAWTLAVNRVYEAQFQVTWSKARRVFLRATPEGDVVEITREEVEAWLDHAPVWSAS